MKKISKPTLGWREWVDFPELKLTGVKAKIDTGARSSALHAEEVQITRGPKGAIVNFTVLPDQRSNKRSIQCSAKLSDERWIRSSNGQRELRPVIRTKVLWSGFEWELDLTLTSRDEMGFRLLLGREALKKRALIDPGRSFLGTHEMRHRSKSNA